MNGAALSALGRRIEEPPISWLMSTTLAKPGLISLAAGFTDSESLPVVEARALLETVLSSRKSAQSALQYGTTAGDPELRRLTAERVAGLDRVKARGGAYSPDRVIITNGSQQMLYMATEALCDPGDIVLVEDPTYFVYLGIVQSHGIEARGIRMQSDGLDIEHLEMVLRKLKQTNLLRRVKLLYLVTYYQNPTAITTSYEKKIAALNLLREYERAAGHPIYLLEDAAYRELQFSGETTPSALASTEYSDRIIYAGTYSKPFATGTRVGFGLLPEPVLTSALRIKANHDFGTSNLLQQLLGAALSSGQYEKHVARLRHRYARKAHLMRHALDERFPEIVKWHEPEGGLYFWAQLPKKCKTGSKSKMFQAALRTGVLYVPGVLCYANDPTRKKPDHEMRLSFGAAKDPASSEGIGRLGKALRQLRGR